MKDDLITLWNELKERREAILIEASKSPSELAKQIYKLLAHEFVVIMDALNTIIRKKD